MFSACLLVIISAYSRTSGCDVVVVGRALQSVDENFSVSGNQANLSLILTVAIGA